MRRARKIGRFFSQPSLVAEYSRERGVYAPIKETLASFSAICKSEADRLAERVFAYGCPGIFNRCARLSAQYATLEVTTTPIGTCT